MSRIADLHNDWLLLVDPQGPFFTVPVLKERLPQGLDRTDVTTRAAIRERWEEASNAPNRREWVWWLLQDILDWGKDLRDELPDSLSCPVPEYDLTLRPDAALIDPDTDNARLLVHLLPPGTSPAARGGEGWAATYIQRAARLARHVGCPLAVVTDGEVIAFVHAPVGGATGWATWRASWFSPEPALLDSFITMFGARRFFTLSTEETPEALLEASASAEAEVTNTLGTQVRQAVELLVTSISRANRNRGGELLHGIPPQRVYEAAATVLMRLVFLLTAEERRLLPLEDELYAGSYALSTLRAQLEEDEIHHREQMQYRTSAWHRILALTRAVHGGITHEDLRIPPYGGGLFDPDRFPFLEGRRDGERAEPGTAPLPVDDMTVLAILQALQVLRFRYRNVTETRQLSYKALSVEQIGHVYERLLDHGTVAAEGIVLGLIAKTSGEEPEKHLRDIEALNLQGRDKLVEWLASKEVTAKTTNQIGQLLDVDVPADLRKALRVACDNDEDLAKRLLPYANLLRLDLRGVPLVFLPGTHYVTETGSRREGGIEYTPRELADEIVEHALAPLCYSPGPADTRDRDEWKIRPSDDLLELKICDPACGSGAFLVAACRYLSERLIEAWEAEGVVDADRSTAADDPTQLDPAVRARRLAVERCIYGVDRDHMAVEMAKLSLWLVTMAKDQPFTFLDHAIKCGDSLLGITDLDQLRYFHLDPAQGRRLHSTFIDPTEVIDPALKEALELRRKLAAIEVLSVRDAEAKAALHREAEQRLEVLRAIADHLLAAALSTATEGPEAFESRLHTAAEHVRAAAADGAGEHEKVRDQSGEWLNAGRRPNGPPRPPLHWPLAFPEVFIDRPTAGFDAIVGNPPFLGGTKISGPLGKDYRDYLAVHLAGYKTDRADLVSFFFLRAVTIATSLGLLATNSISQGDTRQVGLDGPLDADWTIRRAVKSTKWPGGATLEIAKVWMTKGRWNGEFILDGSRVSGITSMFEPPSRVSGEPRRLAAYRSDSYQGSKLDGIGFALDPAEAKRLIQDDPVNAKVIQPYLVAKDVNQRPDCSASRYVINFRDRPLERAQHYRDCLDIVIARVKPGREKHGATDGRKYWWRHFRPRLELYQAIADFDRVLVIAGVSKTVLPVWVAPGMVYAHALFVFAYDDDGHFGVLSSGFHWWWACTRASTLETRIRYTPTDCFETFGQPKITSAIEEAGRALHEHRSALMTENDEGITDTYNRVHDPDEASAGILRLRELHVALDEAVADAYGWLDLELGHGHHDTPWGTRFTFQPSVRREVLDRLLELNHQRDAEEVAGLRGAKRGGRKRTKAQPNVATPVLFDEDGP